MKLLAFLLQARHGPPAIPIRPYRVTPRFCPRRFRRHLLRAILMELKRDKAA
jgi:hypothetical protein